MAVRLLHSAQLIIGALLRRGTFNCLRLLFCILQTLHWKIFGIQDVLKKNKKHSRQSVAQAFKVLAWNRLCIQQCPSLRDFICVHDEYIDPEYVIQNDHVSLFFLDPHQDLAVFGEGKPGQLLWRSDVDPFFTIALFKHSKRLIVMPMSEFHQMSARLPDPDKRLIIIGNPGRCGSTLLTQVFECTNRVITYSEPFPLKNLGVQYRKQGHCQEVHQLAKNLIKIYTRPLRSIPEPLAYLFKPAGPSLICTEVIKKIYPDTTVFYLYRDLDQVTKLMYKLSMHHLSIRLGYLLARLSGDAVEAIYARAGYPIEGANRTVDNDYCFGILIAMMSTNIYKKMRERGSEVHGLRFEDLVKDKVKAVRALFKLCGLPEILVEDALTAFTRDSQRNTFISQEICSNTKPLEYTAEDKMKANEILREFDYPLLEQDCRLEGTLDFDKVLGDY